MPEIIVYYRRYLQNLKAIRQSRTCPMMFFNIQELPCLCRICFFEKGCKFFYKNASFCNCRGLITQTCFNITPNHRFYKHFAAKFLKFYKHRQYISKKRANLLLCKKKQSWHAYWISIFENNIQNLIFSFL